MADLLDRPFFARYKRMCACGEPVLLMPVQGGGEVILEQHVPAIYSLYAGPTHDLCMRPASVIRWSTSPQWVAHVCAATAAGLLTEASDG